MSATVSQPPVAHLYVIHSKEGSVIFHIFTSLPNLPSTYLLFILQNIIIILPFSLCKKSSFNFSFEFLCLCKILECVFTKLFAILGYDKIVYSRLDCTGKRMLSTLECSGRERKVPSSGVLIQHISLSVSDAFNGYSVIKLYFLCLFFYLISVYCF